MAGAVIPQETNGFNHNAPDRCARCRQPKSALFSVSSSDRFGRASTERVCVRCLGELHGGLRKKARGGPLLRRVPRNPLVRRTYTHEELGKIVGRSCSTITREARQCGFLRQKGTLTWEQAEVLRKLFVSREPRPGKP